MTDTAPNEMTEAEAIKILGEKLVDFKWQKDFPHDEARIAAHYDAVIAAMRAAYEAGRARADERESKWQPIETAPKDGTAILAKADAPNFRGDNNSLVVVSWQDGFWVAGGGTMGERWATIRVDKETLTHWQPLPSPPTEQEKM